MGGRIELWGKDSKDDISFELKEDSDCLGKKAGRDFYGTFFALKTETRNSEEHASVSANADLRMRGGDPEKR